MPMNDSLHGTRVAVLGLGKSGIAAARACLSRGAKVRAVDSRPRERAGHDLLALEADGVELVLGDHEDDVLLGSELVVVSPGVPPIAAIEAAERAAIPVVGELELGVRLARGDAPVVAVGGTNGKSTVTTLVGALLATKYGRVFVGGNLGEPLSAHVDEEHDVRVLEVSSFQMERVDRFCPKSAALLNVTPDHLDRYESFQAYADAKGNAFCRQGEGDVAVVPAFDPVCEAQAHRGGARVVTFGPGGDVDVTDEAIVWTERGVAFARDAIGLRGGHNMLNVAAALALVSPFDLDVEAVRRVLAGFRPLAHRMELVRERDGVRYYDDSKGTNVGATVTALLGLVEEKAVLLCGGRDKGGSYGPLVDALKARGRAAVLYGESAPLIDAAIAGQVPTRRATTLAEAVRIGSELAQSGDAVLLSPACSSFDMFRDYAHRGEEFVKAVLALS